jgi:hypothetical protein
MRALPVGSPSRSFSGSLSSNLHASAAGTSARRGGLASRQGAPVCPASAISATPCGTDRDDRFIAAACFLVARLTTNSPVSSTFRWLALRPPLEKPTMAGVSQEV